MDLNKVMLIGRLTRDPETKKIPSGAMVAAFTVATGRQWTDAAGEKQKQTEFTAVSAWGKLGETVAPFLRKGRQVYVEGRLQTSEWAGNDGAKRQKTEVVAESIILLGGKEEGAV